MLLLSCAGGEPVDTAPPVSWESLSVQERCFAEISGAVLPEYDAYHPTIGTHCSGTDHQNINSLERIVFLGDSVTAGTPPTPSDGYYRAILTERLAEQFGTLEISDCSAWGAGTGDLLGKPHEQLATCFPEPEDKRTLVVVTAGGEDMLAAARLLLDGASREEMLAAVDGYADQMDDAIRWIRDNEALLFPGGVSVIFGSVFEYTDATGDLSACSLADDLGYAGEGASALREGYVRLSERFMQTATATRTDMVFLLEHFCGHGFYAEDSSSVCYRGLEAAEVWLDLTCTHPNPAGHAAIAEMFFDVVME